MEPRGKRWFALSFCFITMAMVLAASTQAAAQEFIYTSNFADNSVSAFALNTTTGKVTEVQTSPFGGGGSGAAEGPVNMTHSPDGRFVFVTFTGQLIDRPCGINNGELLSYSVDPHTGALALLDEEVLSGICSSGIALDPSGKFIYAASFPTDDPKIGIIDGFQIDNGHLIPLPGTPFVSPVQAADGQNPVFQNLAIARDGKVLYAADPNEGNGIAIFDRDTRTGALTFREAFNSGTPFDQVAVTPSGKFLLAPGGNVMFQYEIGPQDNLTPVAGSPFSVPGGAGFAAASPDGEFVATTGLGVSMLRETHRDQLALVPGSPFGGDSATGTDITFDPLGRFVLLPGFVFRVHPETGTLTQVADFAGGNAITVLRPCKIHDERRGDKHDGDNKDFDDKKDDNGKNVPDCNDGEGSRGRD